MFTGLTAQFSSPVKAAAPAWAVWRPVAALALAILALGAAGRPAPPLFRLEIEGVVAGLLLMAVGLRRPWLLARGGAADDPPWVKTGSICLLILMWPPLMRAALAGWPAADVVRDIVPLFFLFLPLALVPALRPAGPAAVVVLTAAMMLEGLFYALRWWNHAGWGFGALGVRVLPDGGGYLLNAPSVLFAAVAWPLAALHFAERGDVRGWCGAAFALFAGALCVAGLLGAAHRLAAGLILIAAGVALWTRAKRMHWLIPVLAAAAIGVFAAEGDRIVGLLFHVAEKNRLAGGNARLEEAAAALARAGGSLAAAVFGEGWGARIENPAVGGWRVSYTHTFATYLVVKAGVVGLGAMICWLAALSPTAGAAWRRDPAWAMAYFAPLLTAFSVHTSYKYVDTGILLSLLILYAHHDDD